MINAVETELGSPDLVLEGHVGGDAERRYLSRPFEVPAGLNQLHIRYDYSDQISSDPTLSGGNTLDIGIFDDQGDTAGGSGFRGWSGSNKLSLTIGEHWATPPYRAGAIGAGTWSVLLGPYKVGPRGLDYRVQIWFDPGLQPPPPLEPLAIPDPVVVPPAAEPGWIRGELHCHTVRSDGDSTPEETVALARAAGLEFLAITDHNSARPVEIDPGTLGDLILIPGVEVTTYAGHWNAWGIEGWYDFREPTETGVTEAMRQAVRDGAFVSVNHPKPLGPDWDFREVRGHHAIEVWNGGWRYLNDLALDWWESRLQEGERLVAVGGSDTHHHRWSRPRATPEPRLGHPTNWVKLDGPPTPQNILQALFAGEGFISASPAGPQLYLSEYGSELSLRVVGAQGATAVLITDHGSLSADAVESDDWRFNQARPRDARYCRAQVLDAYGNVLALTNPIWFE